MIYFPDRLSINTPDLVLLNYQEVVIGFYKELYIITQIDEKYYLNILGHDEEDSYWTSLDNLEDDLDLKLSSWFKTLTNKENVPISEILEAMEQCRLIIIKLKDA